jgi:hypothetical protein
MRQALPRLRPCRAALHAARQATRSGHCAADDRQQNDLLQTSAPALGPPPATSASGLGSTAATSCTGTGLTPATSTSALISPPRLGAPPPHLHRDWAHPRHICTDTGPTPAHICTGTGLPLPRPHRDSARCVVATARCRSVHAHEHAAHAGHCRSLPLVIGAGGGGAAASGCGSAQTAGWRAACSAH